MNVVIVGGHGNVAMRLTRLLTPRANTKIVSIFRNPAHSDEVSATGATPLVLSLEDAPKERFAEVFGGIDVVYFSAGAGGKGEPDRTRKVDYDGALKVFDALELVRGPKPRLIMVSALDARDRNIRPPHYTDEDLEHSVAAWKMLGAYIQAKYDADKNLVGRTAFKWTIVRPGALTNEPGTGRATVGKAPLKSVISRDDVALTLALLVDRPDAAGLAIDLNGDNDEIEQALDAFIKKGETDFLG
ncbi:uncharacterized protein PHACADRAFT_264166 [Phanerochaete carnosa HHB-10118-sp]|uniref:NAD(P)-binding domain-containing protein n=1 Tax=Phanerochaete carnosa (strain HHB-10118-sp) TaxID=650164 RepID=K5WKC9_PHACS|nr:uncharacterized protein PHACADRAFT_264166 [Phanerochaete carnosa HHB-10118-sp]EKM50722.1 hypothetical protein PHACADRAFT_264166 [Phanerochaete carnosa HHB-10118-sp]